MSTKTFPKLYARGSGGQILEWTISAVGDHYFTVSGQVDGKKVTSAPNVCEAKNIGKKNEITAEDQAVKEALAKWEKKKKEKYKEDVKDIDVKTFFKPMLAKKYLDYLEDITFPVYIQPKLNGIRCIATRLGLFSRTGEQFFCIAHILESLQPIFKKDPDAVIDGELFNPDARLNQISHLVSVNRAEEDVTPLDLEEARLVIQYHVYDLPRFGAVTLDTPFEERFAAIQKHLNNLKYIHVVPTVLAQSHKEVKQALKEARLKKEEGKMVRIAGSKYIQGKCDVLLKYKNFYDAEYRVVGIGPGTGGWSKCAKVISCITADGKPFNSNVRGTREHLEQVLKNKEFYIGKFVTVEYGEISEYGIPLTPYTELLPRDYE